MIRVPSLAAMIAGLVLMLFITPSWAQPVCASPGCNPTASDANLNTAGGTEALHGVTTGSLNTAFGRFTLYGSNGFNNTAVGAFAGEWQEGSDNTAVGSYALRGTLQVNSPCASLVPSSGSGNTAIGVTALLCNTTGTNNTASGTEALSFNLTGNNNTATGASALLGNTTGNLNTASGFQALNDNVSGANNTAIGAKALKKSTGTKNIAIGFQAGVSLVNGNNNIFIGNQGAGDESQTIRIGTAQTQTFIAGIGTTPVSGAIVMVDSGTGQLGSGPPSSARYKQDIETMGHRSAGVLQLRPVTFAYRGDAAGTAHYGLIAEEVAAVYPELVVRSSTGEVQTVKYLELIPMLLNEVQRQQQAIKRQEQELAEMSVLRKEMAELRALVGQGREMAASSR